MARTSLLVALLLAAVTATNCEALLAGASLELSPLEHEEASVGWALDGDDECLEGSPGASDAACGLNALQRRGSRRTTPSLSLGLAAREATAEGRPGSGADSPGVRAAAAKVPAVASPTEAEASRNGAGSGPPTPALDRWRLLFQDLGAAASGDARLRTAGALCFLALGALCVCDAAARWRHRARFLECVRKVQHVHRELVRQDHDHPLCPYCIEFVQGAPSSGKVVFLCGHCFHLSCANSFFRDHQERAGLCPICCEGIAKVAEQPCGGRAGTSKAAPGAAEAPAAAEGATAAPTSGPRGAPQNSSLKEGGRSFLLTSLRRMYPETISEACMLRWASCHVEIWLQELTQPKYKSFLCRPR
mmetsp:Transcript_116496/g.371782  ORF Transcript_116496/g.371782 Transcript_116496/m.371782 type:complete len:361 (-) Transcript_116496:52-1134(-)